MPRSKSEAILTLRKKKIHKLIMELNRGMLPAPKANKLRYSGVGKQKF